jgi:hypothetical protein
MIDNKMKLFNFSHDKRHCNSRISNRIFYSSFCEGNILSTLLLLSAMLIVTYSLTSGLSMAETNSVMASLTAGIDQSLKIYNCTIPNAESVYASQSMSLPTSVRSFVIYIGDEAHENTATASWKHVSDHNPIYIPTNLVIPQGVTVSFLDADAPWDTPHPHTINVIESSTGKLAYTTGRLDYTNSSKPVVLLAGKYNVIDTNYAWMKGSITVTANQQKQNSIGTSNNTGNLIIGGFYTPTNQVANNKDNDGGVHPGWLGYYKAEFPKHGLTILSQYNFHYAACKYCPGGFWPDQKTADHTLIIFSTQQPLSVALNKLAKTVWNNVYI